MNRRSFLAALTAVAALPKLAMGAFRPEAKPAISASTEERPELVRFPAADVGWLDHPVYATHSPDIFECKPLPSTVFPGMVDLRAFPHLRPHVELACHCWRQHVIAIADERIPAGSLVAWVSKDQRDGRVRLAQRKDSWPLGVTADDSFPDDQIRVVREGSASVRVVGISNMLEL